ncbi:alpha-2-macroglobulin domain protein [Bacteroides coprosuis DSM 18011]|uniref:Alpha-2-macroglobulin domain protein n=1 Tax=Bacteroides coprosuis DSM 18011 TaxID=679937 RepID=F3ZUT7_9BACE|nr:MG2 domain-containing protein [Bacteroides coprosuis]EGJ71397.1 alpha-2-macroglobulin domain protein [Bacteroides coprosuis DSM 18011]
MIISKHRISLLFLCSVLILPLLLWNCSSQNEKEIEPSSDFIPYISGYSGGIQSVNAPITLELTNIYPDAVPNQIIDKRLFSIGPSIEGNAVWKNTKTIQFIPKEGLKSNTQYVVTFHLGELYKVDPSLRNFKYSFRTKIADGILELKDFIQYESSPDEVSLLLDFKLSDLLDMTGLNKAISVFDQEDVKLDFKLKTIDATSFEIQVDGIKRTDKRRHIKVFIDGVALKLRSYIEQEFTIPAKNDFYVVQSKRISEPEKGIEVVFSEALSKRQNIESFISLSGIESFVTQIQDNKLYIYFEDQTTETLQLTLYNYIQSTAGNQLKEDQVIDVEPSIKKPEVVMISTGTILPNSEQQMIAFKAVGIEYLDLQVVKVFSSNLLSFLQANNLSGSEYLKRSGRLILKKRIDLKELTPEPLDKEQSFKLDLSSLFEQEAGALYHIALSFKPEYTILPEFYSRRGDMNLVELDKTDYNKSDWDSSEYYYNSLNLSIPYDWSVYDWKKQNDPTDLTFYMDDSRVSTTTNVYSTNIGLTVKQNLSGKLWVAVNDILTTKPMSGVKVKVYSYQLQVLDELHTDKHGFAEVQCKGVPYIVVAEYDQDKTYLKVPQGSQLTTSRFDVGGVVRENGLKGFIYGERGVWRPGDTMHLTFMLEDREKLIPENHPVALELFNPRGQFYIKLLSTQNKNGVYYFEVKTDANDPTGLWNAYVKIGGSTFHKSLRVETIKPNRLKINLDFAQDILDAGSSANAALSANWLMGASGANLNAKIEMAISPIRSSFPKYDDYLFTNLNSYFNYNKTEVFDGTLDGNGRANLNLDMPVASDAPGLLKAQFITRVYEVGGDFSIHTQPMTLSPYKSYVGMKIRDAKENDYLETDKSYQIDFISLNKLGKALSNQNLHYEVYYIGWSWWYDKENYLASYVHNSSVKPIQKGDLITNNSGKASFDFQINYPDYGQFLIYVCDSNSGHTVMQTVYVDWPSWRGRASRENPTDATTLAFSLDKKEYKVGENVEVTIPAASEGRALISIENGNQILKHEWVDTRKGVDTKYTFKVTSDMAPNVYVYASLLQPHAQTVNNSPIRMYGVIPVSIKDESTHLVPILELPKVIEPEKKFTVKVKEEKGKRMTYTLAIVDDGLLDLTSFKTPNPWDYFFSKEALGINTWDMYDEVIGAIGAVYTQKYKVGGDEMLKPADAKANRFKPVVAFYGPFTVESGKTATHDITLPMYVGSVRTMVVASSGSAFGSAEQTSVVRSPLMLLSSLPRVLSIGDEVWVPVNIFAMDEKVKDVQVEMISSNNVKLLEGNKKTITFTHTGDKIAYFRVQVGNEVGVENISFKATSGTHTATENIEIEVRNPNPILTQTKEVLISAGESGRIDYSTTGNTAVFNSSVEISGLPSVNLTNRISYLIDYQHSCTEQITSKALPLLYVDKFKELSKETKQKYDETIERTIKELYARQLAGGGFTYWPNTSDSWSTAYATLFLVKAKEMGYKINANVLQMALNSLSKSVRAWTPSSRYTSDYLQAYNLYVLASANKADLAAMNRLREYKEMRLQTRWLLATSYALIGKKEIATELTFNLKNEVLSENIYYGYFGSQIRDESFILQTLVATGQKEKAYKQASRLAKLLNYETYYQTQSTAIGLMALAEYIKEFKVDKLKFTMKVGQDKVEELTLNQAIYQKELKNIGKSGEIKIENKSKTTMYAQLIQTIRLTNDTLSAIQDRGLAIKVAYKDLAGNALDVQKVKQGQDILAYVRVTNMTSDRYENIALTHIIPSGWEVFHVEALLDEASSGGSIANNKIDYQDVRDDRVLTYFSLWPSETKTILVRLHATYAGEYVLPAVHAEVMYNTSVFGRTKAEKVVVER